MANSESGSMNFVSTARTGAVSSGSINFVSVAQGGTISIEPRVKSTVALSEVALSTASHTNFTASDAALFLQITGGTLVGPLILSSDPSTGSQAATKKYVDTVTSGYLPLAGGIMTGLLLLTSDPSSILGAATKHYVDVAVAGQSGGNYLPLTGGTLTGLLTLNADPTTNLGAATKHYVDNHSGGGSLTFPLLIPDGTHTNPSIAYTSNNEVGIYSIGNQHIVTSISSIANGGSGVVTNETFIDPVGNTYGGTFVDTNGGAAQAINVLNAIAISGPPPSNPINLTSTNGSGTGVQLNLVYTPISNFNIVAGGTGEISFTSLGGLTIDTSNNPSTNSNFGSNIIIGTLNQASFTTVDSIILGDNNSSISSAFTISHGEGNTLNSATFSNVAGAGNTVSSGNCIVMGFGNNIATNSAGSFCLGSSNNVTNSPGSVAFGNNNIFTNASTNLFLGNRNTANGASYSMSLGNSNTLGDGNSSSGNEMLAVGNGHTLTGAYGIAIGNGLTMSSTTTFAIGNSSVISGPGTVAQGDQVSDFGNIGGNILGGVGVPAPGFASLGGCQREEYIFSGTAHASAVQLTVTNDDIPGAFNVAALVDNTAGMFSIRLIVFNQTNEAAITFSVNDGLITREAGANSVVVAASNFSKMKATSGAPTVDLPTVTADTTNGGFNISWTPPLGNTDSWNVVAQLVILKTRILIE